MHIFLKSIGFTEIKKQKDIELLILDVMKNYDKSKRIQLDDGRVIGEFRKEYAYDCGIVVVGEYDEQDDFHMEYYQPYYTGSILTEYQEVIINRTAGREYYLGACDDIRLGINVIFTLTNVLEYLREQTIAGKEKRRRVYLSGLAADGTILFPVSKSLQQQKAEQERARKKNALLTAARSGDQEAIENLTMEDFDIYAALSKRVAQEDLLTIVESSFMPDGMESDRYSVTGIIQTMDTTENQITGEKLYQFGLECNDILLDVVINEKNLLGEPAIGRRFRGTIWLQGTV